MDFFSHDDLQHGPVLKARRHSGHALTLFVRATNRKIYGITNEFLSGMKSGPVTIGGFITKKSALSSESFSPMFARAEFFFEGLAVGSLKELD
jgi:hypothetical protein